MKASPRSPSRVGVIGGMGPMATAFFLSRVVALTPVRDDADHIPMFIDNDPQIPSRIEHIVDGRGPSPAPRLIEIAKRLEDLGSEMVAMPCNTAHYFAPDIVAAVSIPFVDMVEVSVRRVGSVAGAGARVGMLASPAVTITGLYRNRFDAEGHTAVDPQDGERLLDCIRMIKAGGDEDAARGLLAGVARDLVGRRVDVLMVACSELSFIGDAIPQEVPVIDTIDVLAEEIVCRAGGRSTAAAVA